MIPSVPMGMSPMGDIKSTLMTMFMLKNVNGGGKGGDMFGIIYVMIITNLIDLIVKFLPVIISFVNQKYTSKMTENFSNMTTDIFDNKMKAKTGSVILNIVVNDATNVTSQAILDHITNHRNTIFVSYKRQNYLLNQKDVILLEDDYFAQMLDSVMETETNEKNGACEMQRIEIYSFVHNTTTIRKFIDKITYNYGITMKNKLGNQRFYFNMTPYDTPQFIENKIVNGKETMVKTKNLARLPYNFEFIMKPFHTNRSFKNLFGEKIKLVRERVMFFIKNRKWYDEKGIPYTLGILLGGPPGTGKTSTIKCIANETDRHIFNINLNNDVTKKQLENLFFNENVVITVSNGSQKTSNQICIPIEQRLYVLEDIDCQSNLVLDRSLQNHENASETCPDSLDLSFLLNLLDGVLETPGRIIIMTSNFHEKLDRALIRPGRIDVIAQFDYCSLDTIVEMIEFFYNSPLTTEQKMMIKQLRGFSITPAEMSKIMFENFGNKEQVFIELKKICMLNDDDKGVSYFPGLNESSSGFSSRVSQDLSTENQVVSDLHVHIETDELIRNLDKFGKNELSEMDIQPIYNHVENEIREDLSGNLKSESFLKYTRQPSETIHQPSLEKEIQKLKESSELITANLKFVPEDENNLSEKSINNYDNSEQIGDYNSVFEIDTLSHWTRENSNVFSDVL